MSQKESNTYILKLDCEVCCCEGNPIPSHLISVSSVFVAFSSEVRIVIEIAVLFQPIHHFVSSPFLLF